MVIWRNSPCAWVAAMTDFLPQAGSQHLNPVRKIEALRSKDLAIHATNVGRVCEVLCDALGIDEHFVGALRIAAELHDIGKLAISDTLLDKPAKLTTDEIAVMSTHAQIGCEILSGSGDPTLDFAASVALSHHECFDGTGYPQGLRGEAIPLASRIVALCDVYNALRADRTYRPGMSHAGAVAIITAKEGRASCAKFDPMLLQMFGSRSAEIERLYADPCVPAASRCLLPAFDGSK
jgi:cyclic di-GMP phosphodiesterase